MTTTKNKNLHQWIMYTDALGEINTVWYLLSGKQPTVVA